jgi:virginiamycin B lyase
MGVPMLPLLRRFRLALLAVTLLAAVPAQASGQGRVTPVPGLVSAADSIVQGPDGALWASLPDNPGRVARITPGGAITYPAIGGLGGFPHNARPYGIASASGVLWTMLARGGSLFERVAPNGQETTYALGYGEPTSLVGGPDGALWMTVDGEGGGPDAITRFRPPIDETRFTAGLTQASNPREITQGPDGALWFVEQNRLGRITTAGAVTFQPTPVQPQALAAGPLNALWYASGTTIRRRGDDATTYTMPAPTHALANGPDGALWAATTGGAVRIDPTANTTTFVNDGINPAAQGTAITAGPDGRMWMTLDRAPYLVKIATPPRIDPGSVTPTPTGLQTTLNPNGLPTTVTAEELQPDGTWRPLESKDAGSGTTPVTLTFDDLNLPPGEHTLRLTVTNPGGSTSSAPQTVAIPTAPQAPAPAPTTQPTPAAPSTPNLQPTAIEEGKTVEARVISGTVSYKLPRTATYKKLTGAVVLPLGVQLDTTKGKVAVTSAAKGKSQTAEFHDGQFSVTQTRTGITELGLVGALSCPKSRITASAAAAKKKKRTLWAKDTHGSYRTRGSSSVATVRGTEWKTTDTCRGTTIYVKHGSVSVWPRKGGRAKLVKAGHRLFTPHR